MRIDWLFYLMLEMRASYNGIISAFQVEEARFDSGQPAPTL